MPVASKAIPMEDLLAITQALKLSNPGPRTEIWPSSFKREWDLMQFLKQFINVADGNGWTSV